MRLRLPQLLPTSVALLMMVPSLQAQDDNTPLGDVARKTKIEASKEKPKATLDEYNTVPPSSTATPTPVAVQSASAAQASATAAPLPKMNACTEDCAAPAPGKTPAETAQNKVKFYSDAVTADQNAISEIQRQIPNEKDPGRLQGLKDSLAARTNTMADDQQALDNAKAELSQTQSTYGGGSDQSEQPQTPPSNQQGQPQVSNQTTAPPSTPQ